MFRTSSIPSTYPSWRCWRLRIFSSRLRIPLKDTTCLRLWTKIWRMWCEFCKFWYDFHDCGTNISCQTFGFFLLLSEVRLFLKLPVDGIGPIPMSKLKFWFQMWTFLAWNGWKMSEKSLNCSKIVFRTWGARLGCRLPFVSPSPPAQGGLSPLRDETWIFTKLCQIQ